MTRAETFWLTRGKLVTPRGIVEGAVRVEGGRIAAIRPSAPRGAVGISLRDGYLAPGLLDLHIWGDIATVSREAAKRGTTAFLASVGPEPRERLVERLTALRTASGLEGAACAGIHLEGPFLSRGRGGALPRRWMRSPTTEELRELGAAAGQSLRLVTIAPELPDGLEAIRWCVRRGITVSLGHSEADEATAQRAVSAGARAATHVFNGMPRFHHRAPSLLDVALTERRLTAMVIADGVHVSPAAFKMLVRLKGPERVALVTDSAQYQAGRVRGRRGAYYTRRGILAGSRLTMLDAVHNAMRFADLSLVEAVRMATEIPARLVGLDRARGTLEVGKRADLVGFDRNFRVLVTVVGGRTAFWR